MTTLVHEGAAGAAMADGITQAAARPARRWFVGRRLTLAVAGTVLVVLAGTLAAGHAVSLVLATKERVTLEHERFVIAAGAARSDSEREVAAGLGFLFTGDERQLFVLYAARRERAGLLDQLAATVPGPEARLLLAHLQRVTREQDAILDRAVTLGRSAPSSQDSRRTEALMHAQQFRVEQAFENFRRNALDRLDDARQSSLTATKRALILIVAVGATVLLLGALLLRIVTRTLTRLYREAERSAEAQRFLARSGVRLSESLDYDATVDRVAALPVPDLADGCELLLIDDDGNVGRYAMVHRDPDIAARVRELRRRYPVRLEATHGAGRVLGTGHAELAPVVDDEFLRDLASGEEHLAVLRSIGTRSYIGVPLVARGRTIGVLSLMATTASVSFTTRELSIAEDLGRRAALALDNAALYRRAQDLITFTGVAAHELRTPVSALQLQSEALLRRAARSAGALASVEVTGPLGRMTAQTDRLTRLIASLLDVTQIGAGRLRVDRVDLDIAALVREVAGRMSPELAAAGCELELQAPGPVIGRWDRLRLEQVLTNLLGNALKFGRGGRIEVTVTAEETSARIAIRDHGVGIAPDDQARIFDSFERAAAVQGFHGHGLGLWVSRRIVRALGGDISVDSHVGAGATFTVELPRAAGEHTAALAESAAVRVPS